MLCSGDKVLLYYDSTMNNVCPYCEYKELYFVRKIVNKTQRGLIDLSCNNKKRMGDKCKWNEDLKILIDACFRTKIDYKRICDVL